MAAWMVALIARRLWGTLAMCMPRALKMTPRTMASGLQIPRHHLAHFCCAKLCHSNSRLCLISPSPPVVARQKDRAAAGQVSSAMAAPGSDRITPSSTRPSPGPASRCRAPQPAPAPFPARSPLPLPAPAHPFRGVLLPERLCVRVEEVGVAALALHALPDHVLLKLLAAATGPTALPTSVHKRASGVGSAWDIPTVPACRPGFVYKRRGGGGVFWL